MYMVHKYLSYILFFPKTKRHTHLYSNTSYHDFIKFIRCDMRYDAMRIHIFRIFIHIIFSEFFISVAPQHSKKLMQQFVTGLYFILVFFFVSCFAELSYKIIVFFLDFAKYFIKMEKKNLTNLHILSRICMESREKKKTAEYGIRQRFENIIIILLSEQIFLGFLQNV